MKIGLSGAKLSKFEIWNLIEDLYPHPHLLKDGVVERYGEVARVQFEACEEEAERQLPQKILDFLEDWDSYQLDDGNIYRVVYPLRMIEALKAKVEKAQDERKTS